MERWEIDRLGWPRLDGFPLMDDLTVHAAAVIEGMDCVRWEVGYRWLQTEADQCSVSLPQPVLLDFRIMFPDDCIEGPHQGKMTWGEKQPVSWPFQYGWQWKPWKLGARNVL